MTDQQLIDATAAAIAEELFAHGVGGQPAASLDLRNSWGLHICERRKPAVQHIVATHLTAMLAKRRDAAKLPTNEELAS